MSKEIISFFDLDRNSIVELDQEAQNFTQEGLVLDQMTTDTIVVVNTQHNVTRRLFSDAFWRRQTIKNRSRIVLNLGSTWPDYLSPGTLVVQQVASLPSKQAEYSDIFHTTSILPLLPAGRKVTVTSKLLFAHDAVSFVIQAADMAASTVVGATRASIASSMRLLRHEGFSGAIWFSKGVRETSSACVFVAVPTKVTQSNDDENLDKIKSSLPTHLELAFTFDGTRLSKAGAISISRRASGLLNRGEASLEPLVPSNDVNPLVPSNSTPLAPSSVPPLVPSNVSLTFRVPIIYSFSGNASVVTPEFSEELAKYAAFRLNEPTRPHDQPGTLPTGAMIDQSPFVDDQDLPAVAVRASINISLFNSGTPVLGVVGAYTSTISEAIQNVFGSFDISQLSPASTSPTLSNKSIYPTFARVCSTDLNLAYVIINLVVQWQWKVVYMVSSSDDYSSGLSDAIASEAAIFGVYIGARIIVEPELPDYTAELQGLAQIQPRILLLMVGSDSVNPMISSLYRSNIHPVAVVAPDTVADLDMNYYAQQANVPVSYFKGWVVISDPIGFGPLYASFLDEIGNLDRTVWPHVADAIQLVPRLVSVVECYMVWADVIRRGSASGLDFTNGPTVYQELLQTSFVSLSGNLSFLPNGDRPPTYEVWNVQNNRQVHLGRWNQSTTLADLGVVVWPDGTTVVPIAVPHEWLSYTSPAGIVFMTLAAVGIVLCLMIIGIVIWQRSSRIVVAATWPFLIIMLIGAIIGLASVFSWLGKPSELTCSFRIWLPTIAFILILSPLLVKTWRIVRIFRTDTLDVKPIQLSQLIIIVSVLLGIQVIIDILWTALGSLQPILVLDSGKTHTLVLCTHNIYNQILLYITFGYQGLLILFGTYLAFRVRKVPRTYNESAWIARSIYNIALIAGLMIILGYTLGQYQILVLILLCVTTVVLAYTTMALLMGPKLYRLWKFPNQRKGAQQSNTAQSTSAPTAPPSSLHSGPRSQPHTSSSGSRPSSLQSSRRSPQASSASSPNHIAYGTTSSDTTSGNAHGKDDTMATEMVQAQ